MAVLTSGQRSTLETAVKKARKMAELGARNALHTLAVDSDEPFAHMTAEQRKFRNTLWAKAKLLGDKEENGKRQITHLAYELAYETWHKMLFAKFLEANNLLMHPDGVAVTMEDCEELAKEEGFADKWDAAASYASKMLPAIFRTDDPLMQIAFATEERIKLEAIIDALENPIFIADDALGWVYQFWQSEEKERINKSGDKIDGEKLPAVTQLFTEPYMVHFLIDNTLGAWWVSRNPGVPPPVKFEYLRVAPTKVAPKVAPASSRSNNDTTLRKDGGATFKDGGATFNHKFFNPFDEIEKLTGNLPHWRQEGKIYFVTFRTADSMPQEKLKEWQAEMDIWKGQNPEPYTVEQKKEYYDRFPVKMQEYLDAGHGACELEKPAIKAIVENAIRHFEGDRYRLDEWVVAANHVHVLVEPMGKNQLSDILHSWKSFTSNEINKITGNKGVFWQKESFDHLVRSEASLEKFKEYIRKHDKVAPASSRSNDVDKTLRQDSGATFNVAPASSRSNDVDKTLRQDSGATFGGATFEGWPNKTALVTALDPCMGSGHFVASLFPVFASLRMHEEGLTKEQATDKVITENLHGLELDARCTQIAAFNLALTAWKFCGHYKELPEMNLACSGIAPKGKKEDWIKLVHNEPDAAKKQRLENGMGMLYDHFQLAPELGSLLDPTTIKADAFTANFTELQPVLNEALENEVDIEQHERGVVAAGIAKAGELLSRKYTLQITNVPYLGKGKFDKTLSDYVLKYYGDAKGDLATVFLARLIKTSKSGGIICSIMPQNWLFLTSFKKYREFILKKQALQFVIRLGEHVFENTEAAGAFACIASITNLSPTSDHKFFGLNVSNNRGERPIYAAEKQALVKANVIKTFIQKEQLGNPDARIIIERPLIALHLLSKYADAYQGISPADFPKFGRNFWEIIEIDNSWWLWQSTVKETKYYGGKELILWYSELQNKIKDEGTAYIRGTVGWGKDGISVSAMGYLPVTISKGQSNDTNAAVIIPKDRKFLIPIWCFCSSTLYNEEVRKIDQSLKVTNTSLTKVPFDLAHWQKIAAEKYPNGLPKPYSDDPTQWLFHGHPIKTHNPLQVAVARILGCRWPAEVEAKVEAASSGLDNNNAAGSSDYVSSSGLNNNNAAGSSVYDTLAPEARELINAIKAFDHLSDEDGIFCIPSVNAEQAGAERLREYLQQVFGNEWNSQTIPQLLQKVEAASSSLEDYLRNEFFVQHCKVFQNRPFIWHIWDGRKDGFSVLVNYHKLDKDNLSKLIYTYLGDWIRLCEAKKKTGESGADGLLNAALKLKTSLEAILQGEDPYDIFVRWKPLAQQPIGWEPDLNDGVRLNIRPFVQAGVLRNKFNVKWGVDRGKNPPGNHWGEVRDNDKHLNLEDKRNAAGK